MKVKFPGIADELFIRGEIPMTKQEVRILAVAKAHISERDVIIDIGAGTGSIAIEAALIAKSGRVFAVEREAEGVELIRANAIRFEVNNLEVIEGAAPKAMDGLPMADVIFVGGNGGHLGDILERADSLLCQGGRLVVTAVTVETLHDAIQGMERIGGYVIEASGVQITRLRRAGTKNMFQALNPVYIIACTKGGNHVR